MRLNQNVTSQTVERGEKNCTTSSLSINRKEFARVRTNTKKHTHTHPFQMKNC